MQWEPKKSYKQSEGSLIHTKHKPLTKYNSSHKGASNDPLDLLEEDAELINSFFFTN